MLGELVEPNSSMELVVQSHQSGCQTIARRSNAHWGVQRDCLPCVPVCIGEPFREETNCPPCVWCASRGDREAMCACARILCVCVCVRWKREQCATLVRMWKVKNKQVLFKLRYWKCLASCLLLFAKTVNCSKLPLPSALNWTPFRVVRDGYCGGRLCTAAGILFAS